MLCTPQNPPTGGEPPDATLWTELVAFASAPGVLEATLSIGLVVAFVFVWWRLARLVQNVRERTALEDYLLRLIEDSNLCALHAKRITCTEEDAKLVKSIRIEKWS